MPLSVSTTFSRTLFGPVLSLNSSESLHCNTMLSLMAWDILALFTLQLSVGFTDFPGMWTWKLGNSYKSRPGLEDYCSCVYQHIIFLATFYYIRDEPFFFVSTARTINRLNVGTLGLGGLNCCNEFPQPTFTKTILQKLIKRNLLLVQCHSLTENRGKE